MNDNIRTLTNNTTPGLNSVNPNDTLYGVTQDLTNPDLRNLYDTNVNNTGNKVIAPPANTNGASLQVQEGTAPTILKNGDTWNDNYVKSLKFYTGSGYEALNGTYFSTWGARSLSSNGTPDKMGVTGLYRTTLALPQTGLATSARIHLTGLVTTSGTPTYEIRLNESGALSWAIDPAGTTVITTGAFTMPTVTNSLFEIDITINVSWDIVYVQPKKIWAQGYFQFVQSNAWKVYPMTMTNFYSMDLTSTGQTHYFDILSIWTGAANTLYVTNGYSQLMHPGPSDINET